LVLSIVEGEVYNGERCTDVWGRDGGNEEGRVEDKVK